MLTGVDCSARLDLCTHGFKQTVYTEQEVRERFPRHQVVQTANYKQEPVQCQRY